MILNQPFNPQQFDPSFKAASGLPIASKLPVVITEHEIKPNSAQTGGYLAVTLVVIDGPHKGASGVHRFNLYHNSPSAVEIAHKQLSAFCHAMNYLQTINDLAVIHNLPFMVDVGPQKGENSQYTEVKAVYTIQGQEIGAKGAIQVPAQNAAPAGYGGSPGMLVNTGFAPVQQQAPTAWAPNSAPQQQAPAYMPQQPAYPPQQQQAPAVWTPPQQQAPQQAPQQMPGQAPPWGPR